MAQICGVGRQKAEKAKERQEAPRRKKAEEEAAVVQENVEREKGSDSDPGIPPIPRSRETHSGRNSRGHGSIDLDEDRFHRDSDRA
jgi:hypothetical protein